MASAAAARGRISATEAATRSSPWAFSSGVSSVSRDRGGMSSRGTRPSGFFDDAGALLLLLLAWEETEEKDDEDEDEEDDEAGRELYEAGAVMGSRRGVLAQDDMADGLRTRLALRKVKKASQSQVSQLCNPQKKKIQ